MIISMVLQALYNVVDSIFITNMGSDGAIVNQALTFAFSILILIIAIGFRAGGGLNVLLSKGLGENDKEKVNKIAGNGIFLSLCIYLVFLLFDLFGVRWFISLFTDSKNIIEMGVETLLICSIAFKIGSTHDFNLLKNSSHDYNKDITLFGELDNGIKKIHKNSKSHKLNSDEKWYNSEVLKIRIGVEYVNTFLKNFK